MVASLSCTINDCLIYCKHLQVSGYIEMNDLISFTLIQADVSLGQI